jgi:dihydroanticapsin dehydrogenase
MDTAASALGGLDVVVNVAGVQRSASVEETDEDSWDVHFQVNTKSCYLTTRYALPYLRQSGGGSIASVASIAGINGMAGLSAYSASKGAIVALTHSLAGHGTGG